MLGFKSFASAANAIAASNFFVASTNASSH